MKKVLIFLSIISFVLANDRSDIENLINNHWESWNTNKYKDYISTIHSGGTMNGDSNGSFWYTQNPSVIAQNDPLDFNMTAHYIDVEVLSAGKVAVAYFYLTGSYNIDGVQSNNYRTRVSKVLVKEGKQWKIRLSHYTPFFSGAGIPD